MVKKEKKKLFTVMAEVNESVTVEVSADTLEEALQIARNYAVNDILTKSGDTLAQEFRITGVYE
jgi:hypothetical protein